DQPSPESCSFERPPAAHQPTALASSCPLRARLSCGQAPVGFQQSALPRTGEEHLAVVHRLRLGQSVPAQATAVAATGSLSLMNAEATREGEKSPPSGAQGALRSTYS